MDDGFAVLVIVIFLLGLCGGVSGLVEMWRARRAKQALLARVRELGLPPPGEVTAEELDRICEVFFGCKAEEVSWKAER